MRNLIRKILRENFSDPEWVDRFNKMNREERIEFIESKKAYIEKILPKIEKFFKLKYKENLDNIQIIKRKVKYGHENHVTEAFRIKLYFSNTDNNFSTKKLIYLYLSSVFGLDVEYYGIPLDVEFYQSINKKSHNPDEFNPKNYKMF